MAGAQSATVDSLGTLTAPAPDSQFSARSVSPQYVSVEQLDTRMLA